MQHSQNEWPRGAAAFVEVGLLFLPGIPAFFWLWPNVRDTAWNTPVQMLAYVYMLTREPVDWASPLELGRVGL